MGSGERPVPSGEVKINKPPGLGRVSDIMTDVLMKTSAGDISIRLYDDKAPKTVANFLKLTDQGFYNGLHFHRVIKQFMLQGGCPHSKDPGSRQAGMGGPGWKIKDEFGPGLRHDRPGLLSMANAGPNTGGSQFFLTTVPTPWLDGKHAIFGEVTDGMNVVQSIEATKVDGNDRPRQPQQIISVSRV